MQRTVRTTVVTSMVVNNEGRTETKQDIIADVGSAVDKAIRKKYGNVLILSKVEKLDCWVLDDEVFFKYAHIDNSKLKLDGDSTTDTN